MTVTNRADCGSGTTEGAESAANELPAIDEFIAGVLRRANQSVEPLRSPGEHRASLRIAHLFADELARTKRPFDRVQFIKAATGDRSDA